MKPTTVRMAVVATCLMAGCGAPPTGPAPGTADVTISPTDPAVMAQLSGFYQGGDGHYSPYSPKPTYKPTPSPSYHNPTPSPYHTPSPHYTPSPAYTPSPHYTPSPSPSHYDPTPSPYGTPTPSPYYTPSPQYTPTPNPTATPKEDCCKVTGGGTTKLPKGGVDVSFGFNAQEGRQGPKGHLNIVVHAKPNVHYQSDVITDIDCRLDPGSVHPRLTGTVIVTGILKTGQPFTWTVVDTGEPGVLDHVTFAVNGQVIFSDDLNANGKGPGGGNIQIHKDTCESAPIASPAGGGASGSAGRAPAFMFGQTASRFRQHG